MRSELGEWNGGQGVSLKTWTSASGSFRLAVGYAEYFWPEFQYVKGYILRVGTMAESIHKWNDADNPSQSVEALLNHFHLIDINYPDYENLSADLLMRLGGILKEIHEAKLRWQFPDIPCRVSFYVPEDPEDFDSYQLTFWQISHEPDGFEI